MKKIILSLFFIASVLVVKAQTYVTIPDANFVGWLQTNVPSAMNGNQMDVTDAAVTTRTIVDVENLGISNISGVEHFIALKVLNCGNGAFSMNPNTITSLPTLPVTLDSLICGRNLITVLPTLPPNLLLLKCYNNQLTNLPALPATLKYLDCSYNQITVLPTLPSTLSVLICSENQILVLPTLPTGLLNLGCGRNSSISIPTLPNSLIYFYCDNCSLTNLPVLSTSLKELHCYSNQLTILPPLPSTLESLHCYSNQLATLPALPPNLIDLSCMYNQLISLPTMPNSLRILWCWDNQITHLPTLPNSLFVLHCQNNNITCFDPFDEQLTSLDISGNPFNCLPNYLSIMDAGTLNYPICMSGNSNGCPNASGIFGFTYKDNNSSCTKDASDAGLKNIPVQLYDINGIFLKQTYTASNGVFHMQPIQGFPTFYRTSIDSLGKDYVPACIHPGVDSIFQHTLLDTNINFALTCKSGFDVGVQSVHANGLVFPGQPHFLNVNAGDLSQWYGLNCASGVSGSVTFTVTGSVNYVGHPVGSMAPIVSGNVFTYTISDFGLINNLSDFSLLFTTNTTAQAGDQICVSVEVLPITGDRNPGNNIYQYCYTVVNSHDPNIKEVYPAQVQPNFNDWLTYTIHFQNTGNAPAINIRLEDVLDNKLDLETFEVLNYSHANTIDLNGNTLNVRFPNIMLADSTSDPVGSIGFIQYRIKPKNNWTTDTIRNSASIYFDFNAPIVTNTAKTYFMTSTGLSPFDTESSVTLYPNPATDNITLRSDQTIQSLELTNITGQVLLNKAINQKEYQLQLSDFSEGIYFVKVIYPSGVSTIKKIHHVK